MSYRTKLANLPRSLFAAVLLTGWGIETVIWAHSTVELVQMGHAAAVVTAILTIGLIVLLAGMEGLEVAVIDKWRSLFPGKTTRTLATWLSARQLFVALTVTGATLLAHRSTLVIPGTSYEVTGLWAGVFDLTWTGLTVLWFAQILPKALAATNSQLYLKLFGKLLFPLVTFVRAIGLALPGEWAASWIARLTRWIPPDTGVTPATEESLAAGWRADIPRP